MISGNEPYYPQSEFSAKMQYSCGATIREEFAARAMQGLLSNYGDSTLYPLVAQQAVEFADALIAELNKKANV